MKLKNTIEGYGFEYNHKRFILTLIFMLALVVGMSFLFGLPYYCTIGIGILCILCCPSIIKAQYVWRYEQKRFEDVCIYIEQMLCSFQKQPKITLALKDTAAITDGKLNMLINNVLDKINSENNANIYEEALGIIEKEYQCTRVKVLHRFFIKIERTGGDSAKAIQLLLNDYYKWQERVYLFQKDRTNIKKYSVLGIVISILILCINLAFKKYCDITSLPAYYITTTVFMCFSILFYMFSQAKLNTNWLEPSADDARIVRDYCRAITTKNTHSASDFIVFFFFLVIGLGLIFIGYNFNQIIFYVFGAITLITAAMIPFVPTLNKKQSFKRTCVELRSAFSEWLRDVALNLQYTTLENSIEQSLELCPVVLKKPVEGLLEEIEQNPGKVEPYYNFLSDFNLIDIKSSVKMLYSISEIGGTQRDATLNHLVERNNIMIDKNDSEVRKTANAALSYVILLPLMFASIKLLADMVLFINTFIGSM